MKRIFCILLSFVLIFTQQLPGYSSGSGVYEDFSGVYPEVSAEVISEELTQTIEDGHPYLFGRMSDFERIAEYAFGKDEYLTSLYQTVKDEATYYIGKAPAAVTEDVTSASYLSKATASFNIVLKCALVYLVEKDIDSAAASVYAERAYEEASYYAEDLESWGGYQYLDNNHTALAVAVCYDWLYNCLDETQKKTLSDALFFKHLDTLYDLFENPDAEQYQKGFYRFYFHHNNHAVLDNTSTFVQALAVSDVNPGLCSQIMAHTLKNLEAPFDRLYPDGGWYEGSSYWNYIGPYIARMLSAMQSAFGHTFGYEDIEYITGCSYFPIYTQSSRGKLVYSDSDQSRINSGSMYYLGELSGNIALQKYVVDNNFTNEPLLCIWYDPDKDFSESLNLSKDKLFRNIDIATMRSSWESSQEVFTGMAVQDAAETHALMNSGTFVLDALGERWITNPGKDSYNLSGYWNNAQDGKRWTYYFSRAEANSCIVINPSSNGGQLVGSTDTISDFQSGENSAFVTADLSTTYSGVTSYVRGLKLYDNRRRVLLQDEISLEETSDVISFINAYKSDVTICEDKSSAIFSKGNKHLYIKIICNKDYELELMNAAPLDTSPNPDGQTDWTGDFKRLAVKLDGVSGDITLSAVFVPFLSNDIPQISESLVPISSWTTDENALKKPTLSSIVINGVPLDDFNAQNNYYKVYLDKFEAYVDAKADEGCNADIKYNYLNSCYEFYVTDVNSGEKNLYIADVGLKGEVTADTYIGGSQSAGTLSTNFGADAEVKLRDMHQYSQSAYYKINIPHIPFGKKIKSLSLGLNQYRVTNSKNADTYDFYLTDESAWQEDTVTYNNAPIRHTYDAAAWYPYMKKDETGAYTIEGVPDMQVSGASVHTVSTAAGEADRFYKNTEYDITSLYQKSALSDTLSFMWGMKDRGTYSALSTTHIASKENANENLRPKVMIETENDDTENDATALTPKFVTNPSGNELYHFSQNSDLHIGDSACAVTYAVNLSDAEEMTVSLIFAQYDSDGALVDIKLSTQELSAGEGKTILCPATVIHGETASYKAFVWYNGINPLCSTQAKSI